MKILLYASSFWPKVGGVERVTHNLARGLAEAGHAVSLITPTPSPGELEAPYSIFRSPDDRRIAMLVKEHDLVHASGASARLFPFALRAGKPFSWTHHGYQLACIDGAGWVDGQPAPLSPMESFAYHRQRYGLAAAMAGFARLGLRRSVGSLAAANVVTSKHQAAVLRLPRQRLIYNPVDVGAFACPGAAPGGPDPDLPAPTFTYVGRLVAEKGVDDLIYALAMVNESEPDEGKSTLKIIGDEGPEKEKLVSLAGRLGVAGRVTFIGSNHPVSTADELKGSGICVIPSAWEEPGALVVLELLAAGKPLIVSERGWLSECAGDACITFPNRDRAKLAEAMRRLKSDMALQRQLRERAGSRLALYDPAAMIGEYEKLFGEIAGKG